jgi:hypothetical protein
MPKRGWLTKLRNKKYERRTIPIPPSSSSSSNAGPTLTHEDAEASNTSEYPLSRWPPEAPSLCWNKALERLREKHPQRHDELRTIAKMTMDGTVEAAMVITSAKDQVQKLDARDWRTRQTTSQVLRAMMSLERIFKTVALLDPYGGASVACGSIFSLVQITLVDVKQYRFCLDFVPSVSSVTERWIHFEHRNLNSTNTGPVSIVEKLNDGLVDLYLEIMIYLANMATYCQKSNLGMDMDSTMILIA